MLLMLKYALLSATVLMLVALGGCFSEHSGVINLALEGIMVIGGLVGTMALNLLPADMANVWKVTISICLPRRQAFSTRLCSLFRPSI